MSWLDVRLKLVLMPRILVLCMVCARIFASHIVDLNSNILKVQIQILVQTLDPYLPEVVLKQFFLCLGPDQGQCQICLCLSVKFLSLGL